MRSSLAATAFTAMIIACANSASAQEKIAGSPPYTFNVPLKISGLLPDVKTIRVDCTISGKPSPGHANPAIAEGFVQVAPKADGSFVGTVSVPINTLFAGRKSTDIPTADHYSCGLSLSNKQTPGPLAGPDWAYYSDTGGKYPAWGEPKPGAPLVGIRSDNLPKP